MIEFNIAGTVTVCHNKHITFILSVLHLFGPANPMTNNSTESWNQRISTIAETSHLPLYRMITTIKEEQQNNQVYLARRARGDPVKAEKRKQVQLNMRLYNLVSTYKDRKLGAFVRGIAANMYNSRYSRQGQQQATKPQIESIADTQVISNCTVNQAPGTSTSFCTPVQYRKCNE
jgi:hypothetical protein